MEETSTTCWIAEYFFCVCKSVGKVLTSKFKMTMTYNLNRHHQDLHGFTQPSTFICHDCILGRSKMYINYERRFWQD